MFTLEQILVAHSRVESGADFPAYIATIRGFGVREFTTCVEDGRTQYRSLDGSVLVSPALYETKSIRSEVLVSALVLLRTEPCHPPELVDEMGLVVIPHLKRQVGKVTLPRRQQRQKPSQPDQRSKGFGADADLFPESSDERSMAGPQIVEQQDGLHRKRPGATRH